jgi:formate transporter
VVDSSCVIALCQARRVGQAREPHDDAFRIDAYRPEEIAEMVRDGGPAKADQNAVTTLALGVLAGAFVGIGAAFATATMTGSTGGYGWNRFLGGVAFATGVVLALVGGAQLFTSNSLIVMAWASNLVSLPRLLRNWLLVWVGNFVGAVSTAVLVFATGQASQAGGAVGVTALSIADMKLDRTVTEEVAAGILGNALVCLAVWISYSAHSTTDRVVSVLPPIIAMVSLNADHAVGNMYYLAMGILVSRNDEVLDAAGRDVFDHLDVAPAFGNLLAVTAGNIIGGGVLVAAAYWFVYLRSNGTAAG